MLLTLQELQESRVSKSLATPCFDSPQKKERNFNQKKNKLQLFQRKKKKKGYDEWRRLQSFYVINFLILFISIYFVPVPLVS